MLTRPNAGWSDFSIDNKHMYSLSYLTDVGMEWLDNAIHGLKTMSPFSVHGYCEPGRVICTVSYRNCYIIFDDEYSAEDNTTLEVFGVTIDMVTFCKSLYSDIGECIDDWIHWDDSGVREIVEERYAENHSEAEEWEWNNTEVEVLIAKEYESIRNEYNRKLKELKELIDENEEHFGAARGFF